MSEKRGCFKVGCLGCLGVTAVVLLVLAFLFVLGAVTGGGETRIEPIDRSQTLPQGPRPVVPETTPPEPGTTVRLIDHEIDVAEPGRVILDLNRGEFEIRAGASGEPIRLEGEYDAGRFDLEESYESYGETGWIYRVSFDQKGVGLRPFIQHDGQDNRVRLILPRDAPIILEGRVGIGQSTLELGGLWIVGVDLDVSVGEHRLSFDEPLAIPMRRFRIDGSVGVLEVDELGNASPREVWIKHSIGETGVDLRGAWRRDAEIDVVCGIGECDVRVPKDVKIDLRRAGVMIGESSGPGRRTEPEPGAPTLKLSVSGSIGEVRVR